MRFLIARFLKTTLLGAALLAPVTVTIPQLRADDRDHKTYHDKQRNDDHEWNDREDKAYRIWAKENHRKYRDFGKLKDEERQQYWAWRHDHSDAQLKIDIR
jgi:hypothetical protein